MARLDQQIAAYYINLGVEKAKLGMADPLPPPDKDKRKKPDPNQPPSSPYEPYKSPFKLAHGTHEAEDGWAQPPGTHPGEDHKLPGNSGESYYHDMEGGDLEPWDEDTHGPLTANEEMMISNRINEPLYKVTDADKRFNSKAWKEYQKDNPLYYYVPGKAGMTGGIQMADASAANKITPLSPWRTRLKDDPRHVKELYDPITGLSMSDWKRQGG